MDWDNDDIQAKLGTKTAIYGFQAEVGTHDLHTCCEKCEHVSGRAASPTDEPAEGETRGDGRRSKGKGRGKIVDDAKCLRAGESDAYLCSSANCVNHGRSHGVVAGIDEHDENSASSGESSDEEPMQTLSGFRQARRI